MPKVNKKYSKRFVRVFSRHPSHSPIRKKNFGILWRALACVRFGSSTEYSHRSPYEVNSIEAVSNSANKVKMKRCFDQGSVKTADWWENFDSLVNQEEIPFPIIAKKKHGSRGRGMAKLDNQEQLDAFKSKNNTSHYIFEKYYNYSREYRVHVSANGAFYTCRKVLIRETPDHLRWFRNDANCNWIRPDGDNPALYDKPVNMSDIEAECVKALNAVGLDVGACDVRVQSSTNKKGERRSAPEFIIIEINSAPSFGDITADKYKEEIPRILDRKYGK